MNALIECRTWGHEWAHGPSALPVGRHVCPRCTTVLTIREDGSRSYEYPKGYLASARIRDYMTEVDEHGATLDEPGPMICNDCGRPAYYDRADEQYHHAINAEQGCFLIRSEDRPDDMNHPLLRADAP